MEKIKLYLWMILYGNLYHYKYWKTKKLRTKLAFHNSEQTIDYIIKHRASIARYGDGEFQMITHYLQSKDKKDFTVDTFQNYDENLAIRLLKILKSKKTNNFVIGLPYALKESRVFKAYPRIFFEREWIFNNKILYPLISHKKFYDASFTRFYLDRRDIKNYPKYIENLKKIWNQKEIVIVEGEYTCLGIGNDLFDNTASIERIICPATNAYGIYNTILSSIIRHIPKEKTLLLALGHTATVLAYDLYNEGYQSIDIGHVDIEYEWYLRKAKQKIPIPGKYVNEVKEGRINKRCTDSLYQKQIILEILK